MSFAPKTAIITGANRGLGAECARLLANTGCLVYVGARSAEKAKPVVNAILDSGKAARVIEIDVCDKQSVARAVETIEAESGSVGLLINNAAIHLDGTEDFTEVDLAVLVSTFETNVAGTARVTQAFLPLLRKAAAARIVNVSSRAGQLSSMESKHPAYSISKTALNAVTRQFAAALRDDAIAVNAVTPGWCRTDMGGESADRSAEAGAKSILWVALEAPSDVSGAFYADGETIAW